MRSLVEVERRRGRFQSWTRLHTEVLASAPDAAGYRVLGQAYERAGEFELAHAAYSEAVRLEPSSFAALFDFGAILLRRGLLDLSYESLSRAEDMLQELSPSEQLDKRYEVSKKIIDVIEATLGRMRTDSTYFELMQMSRRLSELQVEIGDQWRKANARVLAIEAYEEAVQIDKRNVHAYLRWAEALVQFERSPEVLKLLATAAGVDPDATEPLLAAGDLLAQLGRPAEAEQAFRKANDQRSDAAVLRRIAEVLRSQGRWADSTYYDGLADEAGAGA